jgi:hypothetical protein
MPRLLYALPLLLLAACTEPFQIDTNDAPPVVIIYGYLTNEPMRHTITVSLSTPYFDSQPNPHVPNAKVCITSAEGDTLRLAEVTNGVYQTEAGTAGVPGRTYTLTVETDEGDTYTAVSTMPSLVTPDSITIRRSRMMGQSRYILYMYAQDTPDEDCYLGRYLVNGEYVKDTLSSYTLLQDEQFNGQYMDGLPLRMFADAAAPPTDRDDDEAPVFLSPGDSVTLLFGHIEKGYLDFISQCSDEKEGESPFFGSPASNITTNITTSTSGGAHGYFTCYPLSRITVIIDD